MAQDFQFDPQDVSHLFNDRRATRIQANQSMKASLKDFGRSQQEQKPSTGYSNPKRPPGAGSGVPLGV